MKINMRRVINYHIIINRIIDADEGFEVINNGEFRYA